MNESIDRAAAALPAAVLAATVPTLLAFHQPPSATLLNQCVAVALWGGLVVVQAPGRVPRAVWALLAALAGVAAGVLWSWGGGALPGSLALSALGLLAGAALLAVTGADAAQQGQGPALLAALAWGLLAAGVLGCGVALVQVFAPGWADGSWIAHSGLPGRAVGNLRQPNHLCSLLVWALVAAVVLHELGRLPRLGLMALVPLLVFGVELTASRTGAAGLLLLLLWAALDRRLSPTARWLLALTPLLYAASYGAMTWYGTLSHQAIGAGARVAAEGGLGELGAAGSPNARPNVWRTALAVLAAQPWAGVGFGEFNFAWTLTALPGRPIAFFDHTHNLLLQLAVELGLPQASAVLGFMGLALWQAARSARRLDGEAGLVARAGLVLVLLALLHSQVEYPLWYAYFLLPTALAWGLALGLPAGPARPRRAASAPWLGQAAGVLMALGGMFALLDYQQVVVIYAPGDNSGSLASRIERGQRSLLFAHHADYAAATNEASPAARALAFSRAPHSLLDTRLMVAWARHLAEQGDTDRARWLAQRLREFRNPDATEFFEPCTGPEAASAFQCQPPQAAHGWREFLQRPPGGALAAPAAQVGALATQ